MRPQGPWWTALVGLAAACTFPSAGGIDGDPPGPPGPPGADASPPGVDADVTVDAPPMVTPRVLVLTDARPGTADRDALPAVQAALTAAGIIVDDGGYYADWPSSVAPDLSATDAVIWLQGVNFNVSIESELAPTLSAYVAGGGVLVRTEWSAWNADRPSDYDGIDAQLPVTAPGSHFGYGAVWSALAPGHRYLAGVTLPWATAAGYSEVTAVPGSTVVATLSPASGDSTPYPALTYHAVGDGRVVHVNHDVLYTVEEVEPQLLRLFINIATVSASP
ncbi:MAG: hypothetical protein R2939_18220 [Kofleriaceae bacterium]